MKYEIIFRNADCWRAKIVEHPKALADFLFGLEPKREVRIQFIDPSKGIRIVEGAEPLYPTRENTVCGWLTSGEVAGWVIDEAIIQDDWGLVRYELKVSRP